MNYAKMFSRRANGLYETTYVADGKRKHLYDRDPERLYHRLAIATGHGIYTLTDLAESWESAHRGEIGTRTWSNYVPHLRKILERHGDKAVTDITTALISNEILVYKSQRYSHTICRTVLSLWNMLMTHACVEGLLQYNPAREVRLPKGLPHAKRTAPDDETIRKIFINYQHPFGLFPLLLICTGLRKSEALALTWEDFNLEDRTITVSKALEYPHGSTPILKPPKTEAGNRTVPIPDALLARLTPSHGIVFKQAPYNGHPGGGYMSARAYETAWSTYCKDTGISITAHQLRHGTATLLFEAGVSEKSAQMILGHASPQTTRDIYTDLRAKQMTTDCSKLNQALSYLYDNDT